jgi:hypothetical protein
MGSLLKVKAQLQAAARVSMMDGFEFDTDGVLMCRFKFKLQWLYVGNEKSDFKDGSMFPNSIKK